MHQSRRGFLTGLTALTAASLSSRNFAAQASLGLDEAQNRDNYPGLSGTYLDNASHHPMTVPAANAIQDYARALTTGHSNDLSAAVRAKFARLINADDDEVTYAPSTSMGEKLITMALGTPARRGRIAILF